MKLVLVIYAIFATYKWYTNYMGFMAMTRHAFDQGLDLPSSEQFRKYMQEELNSLLKRDEF